MGNTILLSKEDRRRYMLKRRVNVVSEPHSKTRDYGVPKMRPCGFPSGLNPNRKNGRATPHIHSMWQVPTKAKK